MSIGLETRANINLYDGPGPILLSNHHTEAEQSLPAIVVRRTLEHYGYDGSLHGTVEISSDIPPEVGLKSSSALANSVALATVAAINQEARDEDLVKIGMDASVESLVSLTGAFDDSFASYYGGAVLTDNAKHTVDRIPEVSNDLQILLLVPGPRKIQVPLDPSRYSAIREMTQLAYEEAMRGRIWDALSLNGLAFSTILGQDPRPVLAAIKAGALGAGLSGKGPAIAAVATKETASQVRQSLGKFDGKVIETHPNFTKATIIP